MAKVPDGVETLRKISIVWVGRTNVTERRQTTDRQTDGRTTTYSERELEFTFAKKRSRAEHVSRAENGAEGAKNCVEQSGRTRSRNGAASGLNRLHTARSNLTLHYFVTYIVHTLLSVVYSFSLHSFTIHALALSLVPTQPNLLPITQPSGILNKTQSTSST